MPEEGRGGHFKKDGLRALAIERHVCGMLSSLQLVGRLARLPITAVDVPFGHTTQCPDASLDIGAESMGAMRSKFFFRRCLSVRGSSIAAPNPHLASPIVSTTTMWLKWFAQWTRND